MKTSVSITINGVKHTHEVEPRLLLVHYIRELAGLTGTHVGCDTSQWSIVNSRPFAAAVAPQGAAGPLT